MSRLRRHKEFLISFAGTFAAVLGLPSVVLSLLGAHFSVALTSGLVAGAAVLASVTSRHRLLKSHLPVDHILPEPVGQRETRRLRCPCNFIMVNQVGALAREFYGSATISVDRYEQLRMKNPYILVCLFANGQELLGYFDVIPLSKSFGELFLRGTVTEKDITHDDVLEPTEMGACTHLYISGLATAQPDTFAGKENACVLVWGMLSYLRHFYRGARPTAFASAVTREGEDLLRKFGLSLASAPGERVDRHAMYSIVLTPAEVDRRAACIPDYSQLCSVDWASTPMLPRSRHQAPRRAIAAPRKFRQLALPPPDVDKAS